MVIRKTVIDVKSRATPYAWELLTIACGIGGLLISRTPGMRPYGDLLTAGTILFTGISMVDLRQGVRTLHAALLERSR